jgi:hypothetical protein
MMVQDFLEACSQLPCTFQHLTTGAVEGPVGVKPKGAETATNAAVGTYRVTGNMLPRSPEPSLTRTKNLALSRSIGARKSVKI